MVSMRSAAAGARLADRLPHVSDRWIAKPGGVVGRGDLLYFGGVFDGVVLGILVVGEQVVAGQVPPRTPHAWHAAFAGVEHGLDPLLPVAQLERGVVELGLTV